MKKGIVLERREHHVIVMTPDGGFHKVSSDSREVIEGDEIEFTPLQEQRVRTVLHPWRNGMYAAAACLLILLSGIPLWNLLFTSAYAAVSIDINPSFELEVDKQYQVTDLVPLNKEAKALAPSIEWKNRELTVVASEIIEDARQEGFLTKNRDVLIVPVGLGDAKASREVFHKIEQQASSLAKQGGEGVTITLMESTKEVRKQAKKEGVSVGKYALYDSVRHVDSTISPDKLKGLSISEISSAIGGMERVPNVHRYTSQPVRKSDSAPKPSIHPEEKTVKQAVVQQKDEPVRINGNNKQQAERSQKPVEHEKSTGGQEHGPKTKTVPKAVVEETKRKAEVQAKKESGRTEEEKKYKSEYGQLQQSQQQGGQAADEEEKKRNDEYKKEREKKQPNFHSPLQ